MGWQCGPRSKEWHSVESPLPSGKHTKNYGKSQSLMGTSTIFLSNFQVRKLFVYQAGYHSFPLAFLRWSQGENDPCLTFRLLKGTEKVSFWYWVLYKLRLEWNSIWPAILVEFVYLHIHTGKYLRIFTSSMDLSIATLPKGESQAWMVWNFPIMDGIRHINIRSRIDISVNPGLITL